MREYIYHCEGPDCGHHVQTAAPTLSAIGWLRVLERAGYDVVEHDYCGWECVMRHAAQLDPPTVIEFD